MPETESLALPPPRAEAPAPAPASSARPTFPRSTGRTLLLTLPIALWSLLMFSRMFKMPGLAAKLAAVAAMAYLVTLFALMVKTGKTQRYRRTFFVSLGFLFPIGFIWELIALRGSMSISVEKMITGDTPFCFLAIPMMLVPAALNRTLIFPGRSASSRSR
jgi:ferredoxin-type protein NapH